MKVAIVDDELEMRQIMTDYVKRFGEEAGIDLETVTFESGEQFLKDYKMIYDIIIFDIDMPGINGIDTARKLRETDTNVTIIFVTNIAQYAINGYEVDAVDYILKPVSYYDFSMKFHRTVAKAAQRKEHIIKVETAEGTRKLRLPALIYVEILSHYLYFHTTKRDYKVRGNIGDVEKELEKYNFVRIHRSYIVNLKYVNKVLSTEVTVGSAILPVSRNYKEKLKEEYLKYIRGED
ncbi:LytTR family DNA-binding domain-containing protein [Blautia glucerasea]|uniref:LytR/AlgR family response regulator transcription factor n=1 Tax=Blautia glucerasea TaxID=536633 RepID=UPI001D0095EF|nr:LytTR family DNA-binding domain-containing protein [Blautia glucerasea]MCB5386990.1 LytTR family DNA-binding domain-containing protein [Blautia glucerasea]MCB5421544.1 LytTR family DNA-binding domain-containing protein [Blautia luti]